MYNINPARYIIGTRPMMDHGMPATMMAPLCIVGPALPTNRPADTNKDLSNNRPAGRHIYHTNRPAERHIYHTNRPADRHIYHTNRPADRHIYHTNKPAARDICQTCVLLLSIIFKTINASVCYFCYYF